MIPPPPHTAGISLAGLRTHIDASQVPSPTSAIEQDRAKWEPVTVYTLPGSHLPLSTTDYHAIDQGNASPRYFRLSTYNIPATPRLAHDLSIPLAALLHPFADPDPREEPVPLVAFPDPGGSGGPPRCTKCRAYINPWVTFLAGGAKWRCNLCGSESEVSAEYFAPLDGNLMRVDHAQRPELQFGVVDFTVPWPEYRASQPPPSLIRTYPAPSSTASSSSRTPASHSTTPSFSSAFAAAASAAAQQQQPTRAPTPLRFCVLLDATADAVASGFFHGACLSLKNVLYGYVREDGSVEQPSFPVGCTLSVVAFDRELHFYDLSPNQSSARVLVMPDIDDPFCPLPSDHLYVDPYASRTVIEPLLDSLPERYATEGPGTQSCFGSAVLASLGTLAHSGGHILAFVSTLPTLGHGALTPRSTAEEAQVYGTSKEKALFAPRAVEWGNLAEACADAGVGVSLFLAPARPVDVGSIGVLASGTGGELALHPLYRPIRDGPVLGSQLHRVVSRTTAYNVSLRVRASTGIRIDDALHGHAHPSTPLSSTPSAGVMHADGALLFTFDVSRTLDTREHAFFQVAVLYTTVHGERRVRVLNLAVQTAELAGNVFRFADLDVVVAALARQAVARSKRDTLSAVRDEVTERCAAMLYAYRRTCATSTSASQLIIPEAFRALPMYALALLKSRALKGRTVSADARNAHAHALGGGGARAMMFGLYPRVLALHDLDGQIALPDERTGVVEEPSLMRASYRFMEPDGLYLADNEEVQGLWVGAAASPKLLLDVFGVEDIAAVDPYLTSLPELPTTLSAQIRNILALRASQRGGRSARLFVARQNMDAAEIEFADLLVEDNNNAALAYTDYLSLVHKQIAAAMQNGGSIGPNSGLRTPW